MDLKWYILNWPCTCYRHSSISVTLVVNSGQATFRHMEITAYRCFLPNLTGFTASHCERPNLHCHLPKPNLTKGCLEQEFNPALADCRKRAPLPPRLARPKIINIKFRNFLSNFKLQIKAAHLLYLKFVFISSHFL